MLSLKRALNRFAGQMPMEARPFDEIVTRDSSPRHSVHRPERFDGVPVEVPADTCVYQPTFPLLAQVPQSEFLAGRPRYRPSGVSSSTIRRLFSLADAGVAGLDGLVYCPMLRCAVEESIRLWSEPANRHPLFSAPRFPKAQLLSGLSISLGSKSSEGFYHFLLEALPRLQLAKPWLARADHVLANGQPGSFHAAWLAFAGVPVEKIRWIGPRSHFRCDQLLFTNSLSHDSQPTPWLTHAIREIVRGSTPPSSSRRRIWISRADASERHLSWENQLLALLPEFEPVQLSCLTPAEQIDLFSSADAVAGPHGAGLANLVFCAAQARIIEFWPDLRHRPQFERLAQATGCRHAWAAVDFGAAPPNLTEIASAIRTFTG